MTQYLHRLLVAALLVATATPTRASASPLFELVGDVQGRGGLTARLTADGPAAAYFNPALLTDAMPGLDLGVFMLSEEIGITVDGRGLSPLCAEGACDVPSVEGAGPESFRHPDGTPISNPTLPTAWLRDGSESMPARPRQDAGSGHNVRAYQTVGLVAPVFGKRLMLGIFAMIPLGEFTTAKAFYNDEREQYFSNSLHPELYSDRLTATSLAFGGGIKVLKDLSVGATFTLSLANRAAAPVYVSNLNDLQTTLLDSDIAVEAAVAPHFGVAWDPLERLRVVGTVHTPQSFDIETSFKYILATGNEQSATVDFTHSYMPLTVATGASYELGDEHRVQLSAVASYARWSMYRDRHSERPRGEYRWTDTLSGSVGARYGQGATHGYLDLNFTPSPVPPQTGRTSYVDSDRIGVSGGADYDFTLWESRFRIGVSGVAHHLFSRHVTKFVAPAGAARDDLVIDEVPDDSIDLLGSAVDGREGLQTNNPGFPGFRSVGWVVGGSLHIAVQY